MKAKISFSITISQDKEREIFDWLQTLDGQSVQSLVRELLRQHIRHNRTHAADAAAAANTNTSRPAPQERSGNNTMPTVSLGGPSPSGARPAPGGILGSMIDRE